MVQQVLNIKKGVVVLPQTFQKSWANVDVFARISADTVVLKKIQPSSFWNTWERVKSLKPRISKKDIENAIAWARASAHQNL